MKKPSDVIAEIKSNRKAEEDPEKMDFLMRTIKAVHSSSVNPNFTVEDLEKHRSSADTFSKLITPSVMLESEDFLVDEMRCQWVRPKYPHRNDLIILYCHGGGFVSGGLGYAGILAAKLAQHVGVDVVSFEYRLAPEHPYPSAIEDGMKVWDYLLHKGYGADNIIIAGDSAGGNLALEMCLQLRDDNRFLPKGLVLMSPWTDLRCINNSYKTYADKDPLLTYEYVLAARNAYAGSETDYESPRYSPVKGDMSQMPPTLIQVGSNEILRDDSEKLAKKYEKCGSWSKLEVYQGGWHVFQQMPIHKAAQALDSVNEFISRIK